MSKIVVDCFGKFERFFFVFGAYIAVEEEFDDIEEDGEGGDTG